MALLASKQCHNPSWPTSQKNSHKRVILLCKRIEYAELNLRELFAKGSLMTRSFFIVFLLIIIAGPSLAKDPIMTPPDEPMMGELDACIIENLYESEDADAGLPLLLADEGFQSLVEKHDFKLFGGPMVGCLTPNSAKIWVRTLGPAAVSVSINRRTFNNPIYLTLTPIPVTSEEQDFTAVVDVPFLQPETIYEYNVLVDGHPVFGEDELPSFCTPPEAGESYSFDIGFGGGARYNPPKERMWDTVNSFDPLAFLFLGDNIYIDEPLWRNKQRAMYYRRQMRPEHAQFLAETGIYSIWDDHDFGVNDTSGGLDPFDPDWKVPAWRVFMENWNNPGYGGGESLPGCYYKFTLGDVEFFMTDGRYYRDFDEGAMLGPDQKAWLLESLSASTA